MPSPLRSNRLNPAWFVILAGVSVAAHIGKLPPAIGVLQHELGMSLVQAGFLLSVVQMAGMVLGLLVGLSADRWGLRRSMLCGLWLVASASLGGAAATNFAWLLGLRMVEGLGVLLTAMPGPGLIRRHVTPAELSMRMAWWGAYMPLGSALALLLGAWVLSAASWQFWWCVLGAVTLLAACAVWRWVPDDAAAVHSDLPAPAWWPRLSLTLRCPGPWLLAASFAVYSAQWISVIGFLPTIYAQAGLAPTLAGVLTAAVAAANIIGNVASGRLLNSGYRARQCLHIGFALMALCAVLAFVHVQGQLILPLWARFVAIFVFSAAGGLIPGTLFISAMHLAPSQATVSTTVGLMYQCSCLGQFTGPPLVAVVVTRMGGWQGTWLVMSCLCVLGGLLALGVQARWQRAGKPGVCA